MTTPRERSARLTDMDGVPVQEGRADPDATGPSRPTHVPGSVADVVALV